MSAEPFYCQLCGEIEGLCEHYDAGTWFTEHGGDWCEVCGELVSSPGTDWCKHFGSAGQSGNGGNDVDPVF